MGVDYNLENKNITEVINNELIKNDILEFFIQNRVKSELSIQKKHEKKDDYGNAKEITDISGVRIVVNILNDLRKCIEVITNLFQVDYLNSNFNPHSFVDDKEFGYRSSHIVVVNNNIKSEIQIRTLAQHIWASTSHHLDYKSPQKDSIFSRKLFRLSGLLEQIDIIIEDLYETSPKLNQSSIISLGKLDYYSLEYYLSRKERIFTLICLGFEQKYQSKFRTSTGAWPFSMKILDGNNKFANNGKNDLDIVLIICRKLELKTVENLKYFIEDKRRNIKKIAKGFRKSQFGYFPASNTFRIFLFLIAFVSESEIDELFKDKEFPDFTNNLKEYVKYCDISRK
jgi:ppGpp synthetase/RelA/SpoT-type nucleotidyltranferase